MPESQEIVDAVVIGAGFGGLYALYKLREQGLSVCGFEAAADVGGTWYFNRYPGARCDVESLDYSYSFSSDLAQEWRWSERFATQPEILRYINHVADRFDLRRHIAFDTRVIGAAFDENANVWTVETSDGSHVRCRFLIAAAGSLSLPKPPDFAGLEHFEGRWVQTGTWPHDGMEIAGKRVAVIGTGSSGMQAIPILATQALHLTVFQRTANFSAPANNGPVDPAHEAAVLADFHGYRRALLETPGGARHPLSTGVPALDVSDEERAAKYDEAWNFAAFALQTVFADLMVDEKANETAADFVRAKIRNIVGDPEVAERLTPRGYPFGAKRLVFETGYHETFNRPNVDLVDLRETPIERVTATGIRTSDKDYPVDLIVFATGFDAMTGPLLALDLRGIGGVTLKQAWADGAASFLGLMVAGFPNLFTINGPGSPSVLTNMVAAIEQHVDWIADCIAHMRATGMERIEAEAEAQAAWVEEVRRMADYTLFPRADSWYTGANVPGKPRVFLAYVAGLGAYAKRCEEIARAGYEGCRFTPGEVAMPALQGSASR